MANTKEVRKQIASIKSTQKITSAMEMVAASKMKRTQDLMMVGRPYSNKIQEVISHIATSNSEHSHPFYEDRDVKKACFIVVSTDKGLCGGINTAVVKYSTVLNAMNESSKFSIVGDKARAQLTRMFPKQVSNVVVDTTKQPLTFSTACALADTIMEENAPKTQLVYNRFASAISFKPTIATVLSSEELEKAAEEGVNEFDSYEIEGPDRSEFLLDLSEFKMGALLYNAMLENNTSELGSRMQSMENSSKNASEMLNKLTLLYNRTRQAAITTELIEIISGASSLESAE